MVDWHEFAASEPDFAEVVRAQFGIRKHCTLATLRRDGSPRISGIEVQFADGELWMGSMPDSVKGADLLRDGRMALHSPTVDPPSEDDGDGWPGEAKIAGVAHARVGETPGTAFRIDLDEVVVTDLADGGLRVRSWHAGRGMTTRVRR